MNAEFLKEYEKNINQSLKCKSYINDVREYKGYIIKTVKNIGRFVNEINWLKRLKELKFPVPEIVYTDVEKRIMVTKKIEGIVIDDNKAQKHLYNIGKLIATLHEINVNQCSEWITELMNEFDYLKKEVKGIMDDEIFETISKFLEEKIPKLIIDKISIVHKDVRPENIIYSNGQYYLLDFESAVVGDSDYDFIRMLNILNQKEDYKYDDFQNFLNGYSELRNITISKEKWQIYSKFYAFRMYSKILIGQVNRDIDFEKYLKEILTDRNDKISKWIEKYYENLEESVR